MYDDWIPSEERDTSLNQFRGDIGKLAVRSNDKRSVVVARSFDEWFEFSPNPDTIRIFVVVDYESSEWQQVVEENRFLVRYDLTADDIERLREGRFLTLSYPPDESMKDIKMWPPYEEVVQE
ncbi:MAG: hypothetical protein NC115_01900 [Bacteroidales bacterium]|nr:hypothetical protein [Bacteroidales bacterium]